MLYLLYCLIAFFLDKYSFLLLFTLNGKLYFSEKMAHIGLDNVNDLMYLLLQDNNEMNLSSSSEDEKEELPNNPQERRQKPRAQNYIEEVVGLYNDEEFKENLR